MLSNFLKRLLFARQFSMDQGKVEILGVKQSCIPIEVLMQMQTKHTDEIFNILKDSVQEQMKQYAKSIGVKEDGMMKHADELFAIYGLGRLEINDFDKAKKKAIVRLKENPVKCSKNKCLPSGIITGMFSYLMKKDVKCEENKCMARGDPYCEFIIKP